MSIVQYIQFLSWIWLLWCNSMISIMCAPQLVCCCCCAQPECDLSPRQPATAATAHGTAVVLLLLRWEITVMLLPLCTLLCHARLAPLPSSPRRQESSDDAHLAQSRSFIFSKSLFRRKPELHCCFLPNGGSPFYLEADSLFTVF